MIYSAEAFDENYLKADVDQKDLFFYLILYNFARFTLEKRKAKTTGIAVPGPFVT